jgi:hypothetical protein
LLYTVTEKGRKPDREPPPYGLRDPYRNLKSENSQDMPRNLNEIVRSRIRLLAGHYSFTEFRDSQIYLKQNRINLKKKGKKMLYIVSLVKERE